MVSYRLYSGKKQLELVLTLVQRSQSHRDTEHAFNQCVFVFLAPFRTRLGLTLEPFAVTKAGVPNNKIFVGEASYGRSFHMEIDGCWEPMCNFTGTRTESDAAPGRCTQTRGYISNAEINDIIRNGGGKQFHDGASNTDVLLYQGLHFPSWTLRWIDLVT